MNEISSEETQADVETKLFGNFPSPWDISKIEPELHIYGKNGNRVIINYKTSPDEMIAILLKEELLPTNRFIFITHGYKSDAKTNWLHVMKDEIIGNNKNETVAILGWGKGADPGYWSPISDYTQAASNTQAVGEWLSPYVRAIDAYFDSNVAKKSISQSLISLISSLPIIGWLSHPFQNNAERPTIWGIGHSLGAHLFGKAGRASEVFTRITGLDPAGPGFQTANHDKRLNKNDAKLVDVIHTDGNGTTYFGTLVPLGTIDFYPSYGWSQPTKATHYEKPSSELAFLDDLKEPTEEEKYVRGYMTESHSRAIEYFTWSIANKGKFLTFHRLDGTPDVEKAVHRIMFTRDGSEMGYYADHYGIKTSIADHSLSHYYIHPNPSKPWL